MTPQLTKLDEETSFPCANHESELTGAHGMKIIPLAANDRAAIGLLRQDSRAQLRPWPGKSRESDGFLFSLQGYPIPLSFTVVSPLIQNPYQEEWCIPSQTMEELVGWLEEREPETTGPQISEVFDQPELAIVLPEEEEEVLIVQPLAMVTGPEKPVEPSEWVLERMEEFSTRLGVSIIGHEEEAMRLFMSIESRWKASGPIGVSVSTPKRKPGSVRKGVRELRNLASSINYEARRGGDRHKMGMEKGMIVYQ
ncbi:hypothetical protein FCV25MIE_13155 [Fagus crenata]